MTIENTPASELYLTSRQQIQSYDMAIGLRLLWLSNTQAFSFGIYAALTLYMSPDKLLHTKAQMLATVIPYIGILVSVFTFSDIISSMVRLKRLTLNYQKSNNGKQQEANFPLINGYLSITLLKRIAPIGSTILFLIIWGYLIMYDHKLL